MLAHLEEYKGEPSTLKPKGEEKRLFNVEATSAFLTLIRNHINQAMSVQYFHEMPAEWEISLDTILQTYLAYKNPYLDESTKHDGKVRVSLNKTFESEVKAYFSDLPAEEKIIEELFKNNKQYYLTFMEKILFLAIARPATVDEDKSLANQSASTSTCSSSNRLKYEEIINIANKSKLLKGALETIYAVYRNLFHKVEAVNSVEGLGDRFASYRLTCHTTYWDEHVNRALEFSAYFKDAIACMNNVAKKFAKDLGQDAPRIVLGKLMVGIYYHTFYKTFEQDILAAFNKYLHDSALRLIYYNFGCALSAEEQPMAWRYIHEERKIMGTSSDQITHDSGVTHKIFFSIFDQFVNEANVHWTRHTDFFKFIDDEHNRPERLLRLKKLIDDALLEVFNEITGKSSIIGIHSIRMLKTVANHYSRIFPPAFLVEFNKLRRKYELENMGELRSMYENYLMNSGLYKEKAHNEQFDNDELMQLTLNLEKMDIKETDPMNVKQFAAFIKEKGLISTDQLAEVLAQRNCEIELAASCRLVKYPNPAFNEMLSTEYMTKNINLETRVEDKALAIEKMQP